MSESSTVYQFVDTNGDWPYNIHVEGCRGAKEAEYWAGNHNLTPSEVAQNSYHVLFDNSSLPRFEGNTFGDLQTSLVRLHNCLTADMKREINSATFTRESPKEEEGNAESFGAERKIDPLRKYREPYGIQYPKEKQIQVYQIQNPNGELLLNGAVFNHIGDAEKTIENYGRDERYADRYKDATVRRRLSQHSASDGRKYAESFNAHGGDTVSIDAPILNYFWETDDPTAKVSQDERAKLEKDLSYYSVSNWDAQGKRIPDVGDISTEIERDSGNNPYIDIEASWSVDWDAESFGAEQVNFELLPSVYIKGVGIVTEGSPYLKNYYGKWDEYTIYDDDAAEAILEIPANDPRYPLQDGELRVIEALVYGFEHPLANASWGELNERGMFWATKTMETLAHYDPDEEYAESFGADDDDERDPPLWRVHFSDTGKAGDNNGYIYGIEMGIVVGEWSNWEDGEWIGDVEVQWFKTPEERDALFRDYSQHGGFSYEGFNYWSRAESFGAEKKHLPYRRQTYKGARPKFEDLNERIVDLGYGRTEYFPRFHNTPLEESSLPFDQPVWHDHYEDASRETRSILAQLPKADVDLILENIKPSDRSRVKQIESSTDGWFLLDFPDVEVTETIVKGAESFATETRFIPVQVMEVTEWFKDRFGYYPDFSRQEGSKYHSGYAVVVRGQMVDKYDTKEEADQAADAIRIAIGFLGGMTPDDGTHPRSEREMLAEKIYDAESFGAESWKGAKKWVEEQQLESNLPYCQCGLREPIYYMNDLEGWIQDAYGGGWGRTTGGEYSSVWGKEWIPKPSCAKCGQEFTMKIVPLKEGTSWWRKYYKAIRDDERSAESFGADWEVSVDKLTHQKQDFKVKGKDYPSQAERKALSLAKKKKRGWKNYPEGAGFAESKYDAGHARQTGWGAESFSAETYTTSRGIAAVNGGEIDDVKEFVDMVNKLRLSAKSTDTWTGKPYPTWYQFGATVLGKEVEIKGNGTWLQIFRVDGVNYRGGMDISVKKFKETLKWPFIDPNAYSVSAESFGAETWEEHLAIYEDGLCRKCDVAWNIDAHWDEDREGGFCPFCDTKLIDIEDYSAESFGAEYNRKGWKIDRPSPNYMTASKDNRHIQIHYNKGDYEPYMIYSTRGSGEYYFRTLSDALDWLNTGSGMDFRNAESFAAQLTFNQWSDDEKHESSHQGGNTYFEDWVDEEIHAHGKGISLKRWGDEEESEGEHQHAESFDAEYGKRQRFGNRYVARNTKGEFISNVGVGASLKADRRNKSKTPARSGFGNRGDSQKGAVVDSSGKSLVGLGLLVGGVWALLDSRRTQSIK